MKNEIYSTKDFYIAALLRSIGIHLLGIKPSQNDFVIFEFSTEKVQAEEIISRYWNRQLEVEPRALIDAINELKTRLHSRQ